MENNNNTERVLFPFIRLWKNKSEKGTVYYTGSLNGAKVIEFHNFHDKNDGSPDKIMYLSIDPKQLGYYKNDTSTNEDVSEVDNNDVELNDSEAEEIPF